MQFFFLVSAINCDDVKVLILSLVVKCYGYVYWQCLLKHSCF